MSFLSEFASTTGGEIVLFILALDTIRATIAFTGWVPRSTRIIGRIIYGKSDEGLVARALQELGYPPRCAEREYQKMKTYIAKMKGRSPITKENAPIHLILLLAKYCARFFSSVSYGGKKISTSRYYLDTMEMVHDEEDLKTMSDIMVLLLSSVNNIKPDIIIAPKGGNPLFAAKVAEFLERPVLLKKAEGEKSKIISQNRKDHYLINYEGSWGLQDCEAKQRCAVIDCNMSGGSQLLSIITDINQLIQEKIIHFEAVSDVFILFRVDDQEKQVEKKFSDQGITLHRYFDLNESIKQKIYQIRLDAEEQQRDISSEYTEDWEKAKAIIEELKKTSKLFYNDGNS